MSASSGFERTRDLRFIRLIVRSGIGLANVRSRMFSRVALAIAI